jgi:hypothetical protein
MVKKAPKREGYKTLSVEIELQDYEKLGEIAKSDQRSLGDLVRRAVKLWLHSADAEELGKPLDTRLAKITKLQKAVAALEAGMKALQGKSAKAVDEPVLQRDKGGD